MRGAKLKKHYKTSGFGRSAPLVKGVEVHPLIKGVWVVRLRVFHIGSLFGHVFSCLSLGASRGSFHGGASLKAEKAHFAA